MKRMTISVLGRVVLPIIAILFTWTFTSPAAFAQSTMAASPKTVIKVGNTIYHCHTLAVHLHNAQPATMGCSNGGRSPSANSQFFAGIPQSTQDAGCLNPDSVSIWWNSGDSGPEVCFIGSGTVNMTNYWLCNGQTFNFNQGGCTSWNDQASSYFTGCSPVIFYVDAGAKGANVSEPSFHQGNFVNVPSDPSHNVPNDTLSSVVLSSNCS